MIAAYGESELKNLRPFQLPDQTISDLKQRRMLLNNLQKQLQVIENQLHAINLHPKPDSFTVTFLKENQETASQSSSIFNRD